MVANFQPIYSRTWDIQVAGSIIGVTANTLNDGTQSTGCTQVYQADATEGGFVQKIILKPVATTAATVARVFYCANTVGTFVAGTTNTQGNTTLISEVGITSWTLSQTTASPQYEIPINIGLPASTRLLMTFGTSTGAANNGFSVTTVGGKY